eukprot:gene5740-6929_t
MGTALLRGRPTRTTTSQGSAEKLNQLAKGVAEEAWRLVMVMTDEYRRRDASIDGKAWKGIGLDSENLLHKGYEYIYDEFGVATLTEIHPDASGWVSSTKVDEVSGKFEYQYDFGEDASKQQLERGNAFLAGADNYRGPGGFQERINDDFARAEAMRQREYGNISEQAGSGMVTSVEAIKYGTSMAMDDQFVEKKAEYVSGTMGGGCSGSGLAKPKVEYVSDAYVDPRGSQFEKDQGPRWIHAGGAHGPMAGRQTCANDDVKDKYNSHGPTWKFAMDEYNHVGRSLGGSREVEEACTLKPRWYAGMPDAPKYAPSFTNSGGTQRDEDSQVLPAALPT